MSQELSFTASSNQRRHHLSKSLFLVMLLIALVLGAGLSNWPVFAGTVANSRVLAPQQGPNAAVGDFVVVFMDSPSGSVLDFSIRAGGFAGGSSDRFPEIAVNTNTAGTQLVPDVAIANNGEFVVVWADDSDRNGYYEILARGFHSDGSERFPTFTVNTVSSGNQSAPVIAMTPQGNFVVAWQDDQNDNDIYEILARGFFADGSERFSTITVNTISTGDQRNPAIAMSPNGEFVVTWENDNSLDGLYNIFARGFNSGGSQRFPWININTDLPGDQLRPDIAMDPNGSFVVTWQDDRDNNGVFQIHARGFYRNGAQRFSRITVNSVASGDQTGPYIAMAQNGDFVVTWTDDQDGNGFYQVLARGFNPTGTERIPDFVVNSVGSGNQIVTDIAMNAGGDFVIPWQDDQDKNNVYQILARGFSPDGSERFPDFTVNKVAAGQQWIPSVAMVREAMVYMPYLVR